MSDVPAHERLTNLVVALMASDIGLTREQILSTVSGYRQRTAGKTTAGALERMFERDKDNLRGLGVRVDTIGGADPNDVRDARYRIPREEYALPDDITFTPAEIAILKVAASAWRGGSVSDDVRAGLQKITALGIDIDEELLGFAPEVAATDANFAVLNRALANGSWVSFEYLRLGSITPRQRTCAPLALVEFEGRWHLFAYDQGTAAERTFLLSRMTSPVKQLTTAPVAVPQWLRTDAAIRAREGLEHLRRQQRAKLWVLPGSEAALRLARSGDAKTDGEFVLDVGYVDADFFADELASYGPEVVVQEPAGLAAAVQERLRAVVAAHESTQQGE